MLAAMFTPRRSMTVGLVLVSALALVVASCSDSAKDGSSATTAPQAEKTESVPATTTEATPSDTVAIPLAVSRSSDGARVIVQASVGGGPTVPMLLDTGSSGVVVASSALGPDAQAGTDTTQIPYIGVTMTGTVAQATVTMGSLTTPAPIAVIDVTGATCGTDGDHPESCEVASAFGDGVQGIIGIGLSDGPSPASPDFSPLLQMATPYDEGFTVELPASGSGGGSLIVGPVDAPSGAVSVPLAASTSPTYPNGATAWAKDVHLCWTVGSASGCGATDLDIGSTETMLSPSAIPGLPTESDGKVAPGHELAVAQTEGGKPVWSFTTGSSPSQDLAASSTDLGTTTQFNTGIAFFFANVVGYDNADGQLWIWPQGASSAASKV
jgi:predicted aspartyl protease